MIVQHPMLWCAVALMAGTAIGLYIPLPYYLPLFILAVIACTFTKGTRHLHDVLTLLVWLLLGCSRAALVSDYDTKSAWQQNIEGKAKAVQTALIKRLETSGVSPQTLALTEALVVGKKDDLSRETKQAYRQVGASHLLALSGMHLGIIYGFLYIIFIHWFRFSQWRWHALPIILLCLWGYALVAGMPVSLVRAALMLSIFTIFSLMEYDTDPLHPLALSAIIILLIAPTELLSISFQLSFVAVFFLLALWRPIYEMFPKMPWLVRLFCVSCVASFGTMPLVAYYFHQVPLFGPVLSIILIPLTTLIIYLTIITILLPVAPMAWLLNHVEALQQRIIELSGDIPFGQLTDVYPDKILISMIYGAMIIAIIRLRTREDQ